MDEIRAEVGSLGPTKLRLIHDHGNDVRGQRFLDDLLLLRRKLKVVCRVTGGGRKGDAVMAQKKVTPQVVTDAVQHGGNTYANGQQFEVSESQANLRSPP